MTGPLWSAVDMLTKPRSTKLLRDDGTADWTTLPSLWTQLEQALTTGLETTGSSRGSKYRTPLNVDAHDLAADIRDTIVDALAGHAEHPARLNVDGHATVFVGASMRHLASVIVATTDDDLIDWWAYRFGSWCRQIITTLHLTDAPQPRGIRGAACPACHATHVDVVRNGEKVRDAALNIDFTDGLIRAASCSACAASWFRGDALLELADLITPRITLGGTA